MRYLKLSENELILIVDFWRASNRLDNIRAYKKEQQQKDELILITKIFDHLTKIEGVKTS